MTVMEELVDNEKKERQLTLRDRCDACGAAAYVHVKGVSGELLFCGHHYNKIESSETGQAKMEAFAFEVIDERWALLGENRAKGDD